MNTIPKLKINQIDIDEKSNFRDTVFNNTYNQMRFFWNTPQEIELAGIDFYISSEYSSVSEFNKLSEYYRNVIKHNYQALSKLDAPIVFIANSFDMASEYAQSPWVNFPKGIIFIPQRIYINKNGIKRLITINKHEKRTKKSTKKISNEISLKLDSETSNNTFSSMIDNSIKMIQKKEISKIVLSREKKIKFNFNTDRQSHFLSKAESNFPNCTTFLYDFKGKGCFFGVTPETLFKTKQKKFYSEALAGTFKTDDILKIMDKSKELNEHNFVVKHIKKRISNFSNNINYSKEPYLINLNSITHMKTEFKSELKSEIDPFDIIHNLHPTPAVCGTPTNAAISNIRKLENHQRGWYSGTLGWVDSEYNSHFIVSIRSGLSVKNNLYMYAGCGIIENSNKDIEYDESEIKFNSILSILNDE
tara:strand:- start:3885 stop:5138 length:1254 start_codon:yes stop_codon:yes gene_type:complete